LEPIFGPGESLPRAALQPHSSAVLAGRDELFGGSLSFETLLEIATGRELTGRGWRAIVGGAPSEQITKLRHRWRNAGNGDFGSRQAAHRSSV
jgi:hypothetical protein